MKQQQGAALVIVMALLSGALMIGMSGMQSALIDERLAGNYRASVQSQMGGEDFLASVVSDDNSENLSEQLNGFLQNLDDGEIKELNREELKSLSGRNGEEVNNLLVKVSRDGDQVKIEAWQAQGDAKSPTVIVLNVSSISENYRSPFLACQRIRLTGSSLAASCRSSNGFCSQNQSNLIPAESQDYNLIYSLGSDQGHGVFLEGGVQAYGSVRSQRDILLTGSSGIKGDAYAQGAIIHGGGTRVWGEEIITESSHQRCDLFLDSTSLKVEVENIKKLYGNSIGDVKMGDDPRSQWALTPEGLFFYDETKSAGMPVFSQCKFFNIPCIVNMLLNFFRNLLGIDICKNNYVLCDYAQVGWTKHSKVIDNTIVLGDLTLESNPTFIVSGLEGDSQINPAQLRMIVEGEFSIGGGGSGLVVEDNAQFEIFVEGKTLLRSNFNMSDGSATRNGQPPLTINSSYVGSGDAVSLNGGSHMVGNIYAPSGTVSIYSSRLTGSIWAKEVNALDSSWLIFNEVNTVADSQSVDTETDSGRPAGLVWGWQ